MQNGDSIRVAHVLRKYNPAQWGGTETAVRQLLDGLRAQDVECVVYCPKLDSEATAHDPLAAAGHEVRRFKAFVPVLGISEQERRQWIAVGGNLMSFDLIASLWRRRDISVVHAHALGRLGGIALTVARQRKLPFVITIHGGLFDLPDTVKKSFNARDFSGWEWGRVFGVLLRARRLFQCADAIIACNPSEANLLTSKYPNWRVIVQPHGVPMELYQQDHRAAAREAFPQLRGKDVLLSVGRIDPIKNQHWLVERMPAILQKHRNALLVLAGACTDETYGNTLNEEIRTLGLEERVLLTGGLPPCDPRLIGLMQEARAVILPSQSETFGLVILEAWAAGAAVISSRTSGAAAVMRHGENGWLFDLDRPENFHSALDEALLRPELRTQFTARGAEVVAREHDAKTLAARMKALYEELIEEKNGKS